MKKQLIFITLTGSIALASCSGGEKEESIESSLEEEVFQNDAETSEDQKEEQETLNNLLLSMPSPLEVSLAIKSSGAQYNSSFLNPVENMVNYTEEGKKALNMGVYGTDMGYINIYEKQLHIVSYATCLKSLAEDLSVGHFFDLNAIERMTSSADNMDSLIIESTKSYNEMDNFLREQNRGKLSVLMAIGAWTEGMNILSNVYDQTKNEDLRSKIAEQDIVVKTIASLADMYSEDKDVKPMISLLEKIKKSYANVEENVVEGETQMVEVDGELEIIETGYTEYKINDDDLLKLIGEFKELRAMIVE